jgi:hypothetical protein
MDTLRSDTSSHYSKGEFPANKGGGADGPDRRRLGQTVGMGHFLG